MTTTIEEDVNIVHYEKRKNTELFKRFKEMEGVSCTQIQNYIPIYNRFFSLNETNFSSVNLNHSLYLYDIQRRSEDHDNIYQCLLNSNNSTNTKPIEKDVFFKFAPLLDPFKFLTGKYNIHDEKLYTLPQLHASSCEGEGGGGGGRGIHPKFLNENNSAYVDSVFSYLTSQWIHKYHFIHGVDFYGSFLAVKKDFKLNIYDDLDYLCKCDFFNKHKNIDFEVEDYSYLFDPDDEEAVIKLPPITIQHHDISNKSALSIDDALYENIFSEKEKDANDLAELELDLVDIMESDEFNYSTNTNTTTIKSSSTCSSRTSHTDTDIDGGHDNGLDPEEKEGEEGGEADDASEGSGSRSGSGGKSGSGSGSGSEYSNESEEEDEYIEVSIPRFPVNVICMESCESTLDELILDDELTQEQWFSALMQIIMILTTYQKCFSFTHNDLHTNNIMYNSTDKKYIYYCYKKTYYKVPTFGRIFKIIDFGRAIYKFENKLFCSDSFQHGSDAATQYNTEPFFNEKKPRLEPNFSFDLCRLACSIFDYIVEEFDEIANLDKCTPVTKLIVDWCKDDNGMNVLYKNNGAERYPDFKLYKMIARCVHNHVPHLQLARPEFACYAFPKKEIPKKTRIINIDEMPGF